MFRRIKVWISASQREAGNAQVGLGVEERWLDETSIQCRPTLFGLVIPWSDE